MTQTFGTDELNKILQQNCFEIFGLPLQYNIDQANLNAKHQALQKQLHPDNFINHPDNMLSVMVSAHINTAYNTLNSPLLKTIELLRQNNVILDLDTDKQLPADFLTLQIELYEEIEEANGDTEKLEKLIDKVAGTMDELDNKIAENFKFNNFGTIVDDTKKLAFYNKLRALLDQKIEESW